MSTCPKCGSPNDEGAEICRECGAPLPPEQIDEQPSTGAGYSQPAYNPPTYNQPIQTTSGTAIASLVCGILGWTVLPVVGSIIAVILGHMAKGEIARSGGLASGDGLATVGLVLGYASIALAIVGSVVGIVLTILGFVLPFGLAGCGLCASMGA